MEKWIQFFEKQDVIESYHFDNKVFENKNIRVFLSRLTKKDGYLGPKLTIEVFHEEKNKWIPFESEKVVSKYLNQFVRDKNA